MGAVYLGVVVAATALAVASVAVLWGVPAENVELPSCTAFPGLCGDRFDEGQAPLATSANGFAFGRWKVPADELGALAAHRSAPERFFQHKMWSYVSVATPDLYLALTPVQFNYVEDVYLQAVDRRSGRAAFEFHAQTPLGRGLKLSPTSTNGCTRYTGSGTNSIELCFARGGWDFVIHLEGLQAHVRIERGQEALALWYPLGNDTSRPAYVHKEAGMAASGWVARGASNSSFASGAATIDWTESFCLRETRWQWVSLSTDTATLSPKAPGGASRKVRLGVNLSRFVYDVASGASVESAVWLDGLVTPLNVPVEIEMPAAGPTSGPWRIRSSSATPSGVEIDLVFQPTGLREDHTGSRYIGVLSDFVQPFGSFSGTVRVGDDIVRVQDAFGVCEDHHAIW